MKSYQELYDAAKKAKAVKSLTPGYVKWEKEGQCIVGAFISYNPVQSRLGGTEYNQYIFETDNGLIKFALGRSADSEVTPVLAKGVVYAITYQGKERISGGRQVNRFEIGEIGVADMVDETEGETLPDDSTKHKK
jgi:hypothetical protein